MIATPGHASHHVSYFDPGDGDAFVGDVGGVRIPPSDTVWLPTPPPDIDVELWRRSIATIAALEPARLLLTHFGPIEDPPRHLEAAEAELLRVAESSRPRDRDAFLADLERRIGGETPELAAADPLGDAAGADLARPRPLLEQAGGLNRRAKPRLSAASPCSQSSKQELRVSVPAVRQAGYAQNS